MGTLSSATLEARASSYELAVAGWLLSDVRASRFGEVVIALRGEAGGALELVVSAAGERPALVETPFGWLSYQALEGIGEADAQRAAREAAALLAQGTSELVRDFPHLAIPRGAASEADRERLGGLLGVSTVTATLAPRSSVRLDAAGVLELLAPVAALGGECAGFELLAVLAGPRTRGAPSVLLSFIAVGGDERVELALKPRASANSAFSVAGCLALVLRPRGGPPTNDVGLCAARLASRLAALLVLAQTATAEILPPEAEAGASLDRAPSDEPVNVHSLWRRIAAARSGEPAATVLETHASVAVLASLRLRVRDSGIVLLPADADLAEVRREMPRVAVLQRTAGKARGSAVLTAAEAEERSWLHTFVSREPGLPGDDELARAWQERIAPAGSEAGGPNRFFGRLLGYPDCCVEAFASYFHQPPDAVTRAGAPDQNIDYFARARGARLGPYPPLLNHFLVDRFHFLFHYPCSYGCAPSLAAATRFFEALLPVYPALCEELRQLLPGLTLVFEDDEYLHFDAGEPRAAGLGHDVRVQRQKASLLRARGRAERFAALARPGFTLRIRPRTLEAVHDDGAVTTIELEAGERALPLWFRAPQPPGGGSL